MKDNIHPNYQEATITCLSCQTEVQTRSTTPNIRVDICANCHPFYTGKSRIVDTAGRVDRFNQRRTAADKAQKAAAKREKAKA
jgi:large subunit ribosomal protein L31